MVYCNWIRDGIDSFTKYSFFVHMTLFFFRLNKDPPNITVRRKEKGGINLTTTVSKLSHKLHHGRHFNVFSRL